jgi:hypothetical protein
LPVTVDIAARAAPYAGRLAAYRRAVSEARAA